MFISIGVAQGGKQSPHLTEGKITWLLNLDYWEEAFLHKLECMIFKVTMDTTLLDGQDV